MTIRAGLASGVMILAYSLVAASVPGLADLHLQNALHFMIVDDPVIIEDVVLNYQTGSNTAITILVRVYVYMCCNFLSLLQHAYST